MILKKLFRALSIILICCLSLSCVFEVLPKEETGSISFNLPSVNGEARTARGGNQQFPSQYQVVLKDLSDSKTVHDKTYTAGSPVKINDLSFGSYEITVKGRTESNIFSQTQKVDVRGPNVKVEIHLESQKLYGSVKLVLENKDNLQFTKYIYQIDDGINTPVKHEVEAAKGNTIDIPNLYTGNEYQFLVFAETLDSVYCAIAENDKIAIEEGKTSTINYISYEKVSGNINITNSSNLNINEGNPLKVNLLNEKGETVRSETITKFPFVISKVLNGNYTVSFENDNLDEVYTPSIENITVNSEKANDINVNAKPLTRLYLSNNGSDSNSGVRSSPLATFTGVLQTINKDPTHSSFQIVVLDSDVKGSSNPLEIQFNTSDKIEIIGDNETIYRNINLSLDSAESNVTLTNMEVDSVTLTNGTFTLGNNATIASNVSMKETANFNLDNPKAIKGTVTIGGEGKINILNISNPLFAVKLNLENLNRKTQVITVDSNANIELIHAARRFTILGTEEYVIDSEGKVQKLSKENPLSVTVSGFTASMSNPINCLVSDDSNNIVEARTVFTNTFNIYGLDNTKKYKIQASALDDSYSYQSDIIPVDNLATPIELKIVAVSGAIKVLTTEVEANYAVLEVNLRETTTSDSFTKTFTLDSNSPKVLSNIRPGTYTATITSTLQDETYTIEGDITVVVGETKEVSLKARPNAVYYVDGNSGNDATGNGLQKAPFITIAKAIEMATESKYEIRVLNNTTEKGRDLNIPEAKEITIKGLSSSTGVKVSGTPSFQVNGTLILNNVEVTNAIMTNTTGNLILEDNVTVKSITLASKSPIVVKGLLGGSPNSIILNVNYDELSEGRKIIDVEASLASEIAKFKLTSNPDNKYVIDSNGFCKFSSGSVIFSSSSISTPTDVTIVFSNGKTQRTETVSFPDTVPIELDSGLWEIISTTSSNKETIVKLTGSPYFTISPRSTVGMTLEGRAASVLYVNGDTGNDNNVGVESSPLATVSKAIEIFKDENLSLPLYTINVDGIVKEKKEIVIDTNMNVVIQGNNGRAATLKAIKSTGEEVSGDVIVNADHRVIGITSKTQEVPTVTLKNITITGGYVEGNRSSGTYMDDIQGCGIRLEKGTLNLEDGAIISANYGKFTNSDGKVIELNEGVYVETDAVEFTMTGSAMVNSNNCIYLDNNQTVNIKGTLSQSPAGVINGSGLAIGTSVLSGEIDANASKFTISNAKGYFALNRQGTIEEKVMTVSEAKAFLEAPGASVPSKTILKINASNSDLAELSSLLKTASERNGVLDNYTYDGNNPADRHSIDLRGGTFTNVPANTFASVTSNGIYLPSTVKTIAANAFGDGSSFASLYFADDIPWSDNNNNIFTPSSLGNENLNKYKTNGHITNPMTKFGTVQETVDWFNDPESGSTTKVRVVIETEQEYKDLGDAIKRNYNSNKITVNMASKIPYIPDNAFSGVNNLQYINIPRNIFMIGANAFTNSGITELRFDDIGYNYAVWKCVGSNAGYARKINNDTLSNQATAIKDLNTVRLVKAEGFDDGNEFDELTKVTSGDIYAGFIIENDPTKPEAETTNYQTLVDFIKTLQPGVNLHAYLYASGELPAGTFADCTALKSVNIPTYLTKIDSQAFAGSGVTSITFDKTSTLPGPQQWTGTNGSFSVSESGQTNLSSLNAAGTVYRKLSLAEVEDICNNTTKERIFYNFDVQISSRELSQLKTALGSLNTPIEDNSYNINKAGYHLDLSSCDITDIPRETFSGYKRLMKITLPSTLTSIGESAFYNIGAKTFTIPSSVTSIGPHQFIGYSVSLSKDDYDLGVEEVIFEDILSSWSISGTSFEGQSQDVPLYNPSETDYAKNAMDFKKTYLNCTWTKSSK